MSRIRLLNDILISQIAAGEVVERPASVVKELVENALDAGATSVEVELESGGKRRIVVRDDGCGMDEDDALLAFDRHATSKISQHEDLERVATLGFRGEALAAISGVARVELLTAERPGSGTRVRIEGGRVVRVEPAAFRRGSQFEVASLFYNVPARRKFLKTPETELRRCLEVVQGYALAYPERRFLLVHEQKPLLEALPVAEEGVRQRISQIYGRELADGLTELPLDFVTETEAISGFVGNRENAGARRAFVFVNGRLVRDRILMARFYRAVRAEWHTDEYPALFLFLEIDPDQVDVNVHPQKLEVRLRSEALIDRVEEAIRRGLAAGQRERRAPLATPRQLPAMPASWEGLGGVRREQYPAGNASSGPNWGARPAMFPPSFPAEDPPRAEAPPATLHQEPAPWLAETAPIAPTFPPVPQIAKPTWAIPAARTVAVSTSPLAGRGKVLSSFRLLAQYKGSLVVLEGPEGLYLVDQHAAHERILFERFKKSLGESKPIRVQPLVPLISQFASSEYLQLQELSQVLEDCGFEVAFLSGYSVALSAFPESLNAEQAVDVLHKLATSPATEGEKTLKRLLVEELAADRSCKAAIKIHRVLPPEEMEALISDLFACEQPYACPHGRPTILLLGDTDLERRFGRRG